jgi:hypothetical protein
MSKYEAKLDFDTVVACRDALKIAKSIFESLKTSAYELSTDRQYTEICKALEVIEKHL